MLKPLIKYFPEYYQKSGVVENICQGQEEGLNELAENVTNAQDQLFPDTATTLLSRWERIYGIIPDESKPIDERRSYLMSKMRGQGTCTEELIKNVAESFANGEVELIEDYSNYNFKIKFISSKGAPPNLDDLTAAIEEIKPAHLNFEYLYIYNTWAMIEDESMTWTQASAYTWDGLRTH